MTRVRKLSAAGAALVFAVLWGASASWAAGEQAPMTEPKDTDMSIEQATDNLVEDSKKAGEKISEEAKDAADWTEEKVKEATE